MVRVDNIIEGALYCPCFRVNKGNRIARSISHHHWLRVWGHIKMVRLFTDWQAVDLNKRYRVNHANICIKWIEHQNRRFSTRMGSCLSIELGLRRLNCLSGRSRLLESHDTYHWAKKYQPMLKLNRRDEFQGDASRANRSKYNLHINHGNHCRAKATRFWSRSQLFCLWAP